MSQKKSESNCSIFKSSAQGTFIINQIVKVTWRVMTWFPVWHIMLFKLLLSSIKMLHSHCIVYVLYMKSRWAPVIMTLDAVWRRACWVGDGPLGSHTWNSRRWEKLKMYKHVYCSKMIYRELNKHVLLQNVVHTECGCLLRAVHCPWWRYVPV